MGGNPSDSPVKVSVSVVLEAEYPAEVPLRHGDVSLELLPTAAFSVLGFGLVGLGGGQRREDLLVEVPEGPPVPEVFAPGDEGDDVRDCAWEREKILHFQSTKAARAERDEKTTSLDHHHHQDKKGLLLRKGRRTYVLGIPRSIFLRSLP